MSSERVWYLVDLDMRASENSILLICPDCGEPVKLSHSLWFEEADAFRVCARCYNVRLEIERLICDLSAREGGIPRSELFQKLDEFGVDRKTVEYHINRLIKCGRLVENRKSSSAKTE